MATRCRPKEQREFIITAMALKSVSDANERIRIHYMTIFAQCFSPCGKYLVAANNFGKIAVFNIGNVLNPDSLQVQEKELKLPIFSFQAHNGPIYSLASTKTFLISAGYGDISAWSWVELLNKIPQGKLCWSLSIPENDSFGKSETNAIALSENDSFRTLFSGGGDNNVYEWDLECGKLIRTFTGHSDYIHCLTTSNHNGCVSGSEDGSVLIWDLNKPNKEAIKIEPFKTDKCCRPKYGKWIGSVALDSANDWLICGGGPTLTAWHLASLEATTTFDVIENTLTCCGFYDDLVIAGGGDSNFYHMSFNGDLKAKIPTSSPSLYNFVIKDQLLCIAGTSYKIDICPSFKYRDFILSFI